MERWHIEMTLAGAGPRRRREADPQGPQPAHLHPDHHVREEPARRHERPRRARDRRRRARWPRRRRALRGGAGRGRPRARRVADHARAADRPPVPGVADPPPAAAAADGRLARRGSNGGDARQPRARARDRPPARRARRAARVREPRGSGDRRRDGRHPRGGRRDADPARRVGGEERARGADGSRRDESGRGAGGVRLGVLHREGATGEVRRRHRGSAPMVRGRAGSAGRGVLRGEPALRRHIHRAPRPGRLSPGRPDLRGRPTPTGPPSGCTCSTCTPATPSAAGPG